MTSTISKQPTKTPLSILCFGDSLTEGYTLYGTNFTPYSSTLLEKLQSIIGSNYDITIRSEGVSGDLITLGFERRMKAIYEEREVEEEPFDWLIFLGGTNDIAYNIPPSKIFTSIRSILDISSPTRILILTVPECGVRNASLDGRRNELNALIRGLETGVGEGEGIHVLDLWEGVKYWDMDEVERERVWDDGLHFTEAGYELVGDLIADKLLEIMGGKGGSSAETKADETGVEEKKV